MCVCMWSYLIGLGASQTSSQRTAAGRQGGGQRGAAMGQDRLQVTVLGLRGINLLKCKCQTDVNQGSVLSHEATRLWWM